MSLTPRENLRLFYERRPAECEWLPDPKNDSCNFHCTWLDRAERPRHDDPNKPYNEGRAQDGFGVWYMYEPLIRAANPDVTIPPLLGDICDWKEVVKFPDVNELTPEQWAEMAAKDKEKIDTNKFLCISLGRGLFERLHALMGMEEAMIALLAEPEAVDEFFSAVIDYKIAIVDKLVEYYDVDMIEVSDDWGHQHSAFFSPETWNELFRPHMERLVKHVKSKGCMYQQHSCGKIDVLVPYMVEIGIDHWTSCQPMNDIPNIIKKYGDKITCAGGINKAEQEDPSYTPEMMREMLEEKIRTLCPGGAYLPYASPRPPILTKILREVIAENKDFFKNPENLKLPK